MELPTSAAWPIDSRGCRATDSAPCTASVTTRRAMPTARRRRCPSDLNTRSAAVKVRISSTPSSGPGSTGSRSKSKSMRSSFIPPTPSVIEWWTFNTIAARPSASPSTRVYSHNGRERSNPAIAAVRARSSTASSVGSHTRTRRRWYMRSKFGSPDQWGGPMRSSGVATRWRIRGMSQEPRSIRATSVDQSGARSKNSTVTIVDRRSGSFSMFHMSASESLMCVSKRSTSCGPGMGGLLRRGVVMLRDGSAGRQRFRPGLPGVRMVGSCVIRAPWQGLR